MASLASLFRYAACGVGGVMVASSSDSVRSLAQGVINSAKSPSGGADPQAEMSRILSSIHQALSQQQQPVIVHTGGSSGSSVQSTVVKVLVVAGVVGIGAKYVGFRFSDLLFISKEKFAETMASVHSSIGNIRERLLAVADNVEDVHDSVKDLSKRTDEHHDENTQRFDRLESITERTHRGIALIARFIALSLPGQPSSDIHREIAAYANDSVGPSPFLTQSAAAQKGPQLSVTGPDRRLLLSPSGPPTATTANGTAAASPPPPQGGPVLGLGFDTIGGYLGTVTGPLSLPGAGIGTATSNPSSTVTSPLYNGPSTVLAGSQGAPAGSGTATSHRDAASGDARRRKKDKDRSDKDKGARGMASSSFLGGLLSM